MYRKHSRDSAQVKRCGAYNQESIYTDQRDQCKQNVNIITGQDILKIRQKQTNINEYTHSCSIKEYIL